MFMARVDVAPVMYRILKRAVASLMFEDSGVLPLVVDHTLHSKEFDIVLFFLANSLEATWELRKQLRAFDGV